MSARATAQKLLWLFGWAALWTLIGLAIASEIYLSSNFLGRSITWSEAISDSLEDWYVYGLLSLPVVWLARRYPPERGARWITADSPKELQEFVNAYPQRMARDAADTLAYLCTSPYDVRLAQERFPKIHFHPLREHAGLALQSAG